MSVDIKHLGHAQHFIGAKDCHFRMGTEVGGVVVSTVGEYCPPNEADIVEIGYGRLFETYVFRTSGEHHGCGCPVIDNLSEIDSEGYNSASEAQEGHARMVAKYAGAAS